MARTDAEWTTYFAKGTKGAPPPEQSQSLETLLGDIVNEFVAATPDWWSGGELRLTFESNNEMDGCLHEFVNPEFPSDIVVATDEMMHATRLLGLRAKDKGMPLRRVVLVINMDCEGRWKYKCNFSYASLD